MNINNPEDLKGAVLFLLLEKYRDEFEVIDGLSQHPDSLTFEEWCEKNIK